MMTTELELPLNQTKLAAALDVSPWYVYCMKRWGYRFTHGRRTTLRSALNWLENHPEFRTTLVKAGVATPAPALAS